MHKIPVQTPFEDTSDLPGVLAEIAEATDYATALVVARAVGGTRVYIPVQPAASHWLVDLVGSAHAVAICAALAPAQGGLDILIPMGTHAGRRAKWRRIKELVDAGLPKRQIAQMTGVHERTVQSHRNGSFTSVAGVLAQQDLFDRS